MYRDFISGQGVTVVSDEEGIQLKETHDRIGEELTLENKIELLENAISDLENEQSKIGTHESIRKTKGKIRILIFGFITGALIAMGLNHFSVMAKWEVSIPFLPFIHTHEMLSLFVAITASSLLIGLAGGILFSICKKSENRLYDIEQQLDYLKEELNSKRDELQQVRATFTKKEINDKTIYKINIDEYRKKLASRLALLECIRKFRREFETCLAQGTLKDRLINMGVTPENISFAEDTLKRVLEKEKVTQHE